MGWPTLGLVAVTIAASFLTHDLVEYLLLNAVYGSEAWSNGLRVVDNKGNLSDGTQLASLHKFVLSFGSFLLCVPVFVGSAFGFAYLNMRLHGKRLRDFSKQSNPP